MKKDFMMPGDHGAVRKHIRIIQRSLHPDVRIRR